MIHSEKSGQTISRLEACKDIQIFVQPILLEHSAALAQVTARLKEASVEIPSARLKVLSYSKWFCKLVKLHQTPRIGKTIPFGTLKAILESGHFLIVNAPCFVQCLRSWCLLITIKDLSWLYLTCIRRNKEANESSYKLNKFKLLSSEDCHKACQLCTAHTAVWGRVICRQMLGRVTVKFGPCFGSSSRDEQDVVTPSSSTLTVGLDTSYFGCCLSDASALSCTQLSGAVKIVLHLSARYLGVWNNLQGHLCCTLSMLRSSHQTLCQKMHGSTRLISRIHAPNMTLVTPYRSKKAHNLQTVQ